ncbi:MAG: substrate-binding domain-containing protein [Bacteroidota bacterium]
MISKNRKIRIKDIAEKAKVSAGTIDRVLHNRGDVNKETKEKVLKIIAELGYKPNLLAKSLASRKVIKIAILIPEVKEGQNLYWEKPLLGIQKSIKELRDFNVEVKLFTFKLGDEKTFEEHCKSISSFNAQGVIFAPVFKTLSEELAFKCEAAGIPYIFIDTYLEGLSPLTYFGQNAVQSGYLSAKLMFYALNNKDKILILNIANKNAISDHLKMREEGFLKFMSEKALDKSFQIITERIDLNEKNEPIRVLNQVFKTDPDIKAVFATNSKVYIAAKFLSENGMGDRLLIGYDLIEKNLEYLKDGSIDFLICQKPEEQGYKSVMTLFNYLLGGAQADKMNYSQIDIIMQENIEYYKNS